VRTLRTTALLAAVALATAAAPGRAAPARIDLAVSIPVADRGTALQEAAVLRGIADIAADSWPTLLAIRPGETGDASARVSVTRSGGAVVVATELLPSSGPARTLRSTLPVGSENAIASVAAADIAWLWSAAAGFRGLEPGPAPSLVAVLETDALAALTGWSAAGLEPMDIASSDEGLTVLFPRGWLTLGPLFRVGPMTERDLALVPSGDGPVYTGVERSARGTIVLARADGTLETVDPLLAVRGSISGPPGARLFTLAGHELAMAAGSELSIVPAESGSAERRSVRIAAAWITAFGADASGAFWAWDGLERRVRIVDRTGREVSSIRPLASAAALSVPQSLAVLADGSFLLGGAGQLWKFERSGIPAWRLSRLPGVPGGSLPPSFALAVDGATGTVWLLDGPSRRVLQFGGTDRGIGDEPVAEASRALAELLQSLDERDVEALERAGVLALDADQPFAAARFATRLARAGAPGSPDLAAAADLLVQRDHALAAAGVVDLLADALLAGRAADACQRAVDLARVWRDRDPGDAEAGRLLDRLTLRRRELRDAASAKPDAPAIAAAAVVAREAGRTLMRARLKLRAPVSTAVTDLQVTFALPGWTPVPAFADVGDLAATEERVIEMELAIGDAPGRLPMLLPGAAWLRWKRGTEGRSGAVLLDVSIEDPEGATR
jgi:hypothetical protein